ncbi:hypothetical protein [Flavobacterium wongokense]|uniref:hypothetical protein n=1 Tax=Flavobacterium wongokense TaxID=2910674 RepID=UPI001F17EEE7|nr:hypothetical protein [Flavobacterium sp. WG47]MCF6131880.1 hypothetical protein [Flavobacterium sp. WG47]
MGQMLYDYTKSSIKGVCSSKELFVKEIIKAAKILSVHEKDKLTNWLFFYTADKPEMQKWLHEVIDKKILVS